MNLGVMLKRDWHFCGLPCAHLSRCSGGLIDQHRRATCQERYGQDFYIHRPEIQKIASLRGNCPEAQEKKWRTFKRRQSRNNPGPWESRVETRLFDLLRARYARGTVERHHRPFRDTHALDLYLTGEPLWIEVDGVYWHGLDVSLDRLFSRQGARADAIRRRWWRDRELDVKMKEAGLRLIRITDRAFEDPDWDFDAWYEENIG